MFPHVSPVVRPLLATVIPRSCHRFALTRGARGPLRLTRSNEVPGGAAANTPPAPGGPIPRIAPVELTAPEFTCAMAASALVEFELSGSQVVR
jgi:hypothetical protein